MVFFFLILQGHKVTCIEPPKQKSKLTEASKGYLKELEASSLGLQDALEICWVEMTKRRRALWEIAASRSIVAGLSPLHRFLSSVQSHHKGWPPFTVTQWRMFTLWKVIRGNHEQSSSNHRATSKWGQRGSRMGPAVDPHTSAWLVRQRPARTAQLVLRAEDPFVPPLHYQSSEVTK